jgi:hypothetical protein
VSSSWRDRPLEINDRTAAVGHKRVFVTVRLRHAGVYATCVDVAPRALLNYLASLAGPERRFPRETKTSRMLAFEKAVRRERFMLVGD